MFLFQCHTFEQRLFKTDSIIVEDGCILMSYANVLSGSTLQGGNILRPYTLVMKNDQLKVNTIWHGVPARQISQ